MKDGTIQLHLSYGSGSDRQRKAKIVPMPAGRKREREVTIEALLDAFEREVASTGSAPGLIPTVAEFYKRWISVKSFAQTTIDKHDHAMRRIREKFGKKRLNQLSGLAVQEFYKELQNDLSARTIRDHHDLLRTMLRDAVRWAIIEDNPLEHVGAPKVPDAPPKIYDTEDVQHLLRLLEDEPIKQQGIVLLALVGGLRRSEIAGLDYDAIDTRKNTVTIRQAYVATKKGPVLKSTKPDRVESVQLPDFVMKKLRALAIQSRKDELFFAADGIHAKAVFRQSNGRRMHPTSPTGIWSKWKKKNQLDDVSLHGLRHTCLSLLLASGTDIANVSAHARHSKISTTLNTYTHVIEKPEITGIFETLHNHSEESKEKKA